MINKDPSYLVVFRLGKEEFGITIDQVQSIEVAGKVHPIPNVPDFVLGLINLREAVIPVIDLYNLLDKDRKLFVNEGQIIIVLSNGKRIGFMVDEAMDVMNITDCMLYPTSFQINGNQHVVTVVKNGDQLIRILDVDELLANFHVVDLLLEYE